MCGLDGMLVPILRAITPSSMRGPHDMGHGVDNMRYTGPMYPNDIDKNDSMDESIDLESESDDDVKVKYVGLSSPTFTPSIYAMDMRAQPVEFLNEVYWSDAFIGQTARGYNRALTQNETDSSGGGYFPEPIRDMLGFMATFDEAFGEKFAYASTGTLNDYDYSDAAEQDKGQLSDTRNGAIRAYLVRNSDFLNDKKYMAFFFVHEDDKKDVDAYKEYIPVVVKDGNDKNNDWMFISANLDIGKAQKIEVTLDDGTQATVKTSGHAYSIARCNLDKDQYIMYDAQYIKNRRAPPVQFAFNATRDIDESLNILHGNDGKMWQLAYKSSKFIPGRREKVEYPLREINARKSKKLVALYVRRSELCEEYNDVCGSDDSSDDDDVLIGEVISDDDDDVLTAAMASDAQPPGKLKSLRKKKNNDAAGSSHTACLCHPPSHY